MSIPLAYNLRNLVVRRTTTLMTALGIALTVAVLLAVLGLINGLRSTLSASGDPLHVIIMRKGATSELTSIFQRSQYQDIKFKPGIAKNSHGDPAVSVELVVLTELTNDAHPNGMNVTVRGIEPSGIEMRRNCKIASGRWFETGHRELVVGKQISDDYPEARIGKKLRFGRGDWEVVGVFDAGGGAQAGEIWGDVNQVGSDFNRAENLSVALVEATDAVTTQALINDVNNDQRIGMTALGEKEYYAQQTQNGLPIEYTGIMVAIIMAVGSSFAAMNTMYAAVARRAREIGTLRVLGFSRGSILVSFFIESLLLAIIGGVLGCLLALPLNTATTSVGNANISQTTFNFSVTPQTMAIGIIFAIFMGAIGGLFPASNASRKEILTALREV
jgi:putative ABC transport system permease protein